MTIAKEVDLIQYLPPYLQEYYEIQKITAAENPEFRLAWETDEIVRNNLYIVTATEQGLKRFEGILGIYPSEQDSNETRRGRILSRWNDVVPYTLQALFGKIAVLAGGDFEINPDFGNYLIEIITHISYYGGIDDLAYILKTIIPSNLVIVSTNELDCLASGNLRIASAVIHSAVYLITNDFEGTYAMNGTAANGGAVVQTKTELITNDFEAAYAANGQAGTGSSLGVVSEVMVTNDFETTIAANGTLNSAISTVTVTEYQI